VAERYFILTRIAEWFVDIQDTARLHVAALTNPDVRNERIILYAEHYTWKYVPVPSLKLK
jgi:nucleoside-diphosphate-sugar epimerase